MGVLKDYRGQGVGRQLLTECIDRVHEFGLEKLELEVFADNLAAIRLYEKFGFVMEGR